MKIHASKLVLAISLLMLAALLTACNFISPSASEPPLPTIVQDSPTATPQPTDTPAPTEAPPTPTPQPTETNVPQMPTDEAAGQAPTSTREPADEAQATPAEIIDTPAPTEAPATATPNAVPVSALPLDPLDIKLEPVAGGFEKPLYVTHAGDGSGRLFVVEQTGRILIVQDGAVNPTPFLDIASLITSQRSEQGLLSVAFHPNYASNGFFFVNYTNTQGDTVISRYSVSDNPNVADPNSARILLSIGQPYANHNGGHILFGPDGYLYIGMGDGGAANDPQDRAQNLSVLLGKILRIDVDRGDPYGVPQSNPFVNTESARPEIWAYGWRNPWRIAFDPATGDMYVGDVGQNQYEEISVEEAGAPGGQNFGWRLMEGFHCFNPSDCDPASLNVVLPVAEYDHGQGCSVTGGYVYRGAQFPQLDGVYFYSDYCSGIIWGLRREADGNWSQAELLRSGKTVSSFGLDQAGEMYLVDHKGEVFQLAN